ncbi:MAG: hypothetical protein KJN69_12585 [Gammaproteobacteria bacterium]|nr:hypothetical protein [Gammaproteobacteria bacterium]
MSKRRRNRFWWPLVLLVLLPAGLYFAANWWLESAGARHLLERVLSDRAGMPVRMKGEFDLMLIPALGVSGTDLTVGEQADGTLFTGSAEFAVAVALKPLLQKTVQVEWIRLSGGRIYPEHYQPGGGETATAEINLPLIRELDVRDFQIMLAAGGEHAVRVKRLSVSDFQANRETRFELEIAQLVSAQGRLRWEEAPGRLHLSELVLDLDGQAVSGRACLDLGPPVAVNAMLRAGVFDLDQAWQTLEAFKTGTSNDAGLPFETNLELSADELRSNGITAREVLISMGREPVTVCGAD